jgi:hypothetical protein
LSSAQANSSQDPIFKIIRAKWTGGVVIEYLLCRHEALTSNSNPIREKKKSKSTGRGGMAHGSSGRALG